MNPLSILSMFHHPNAQTASPLAMPAAQGQSKPAAASSSGTNGSSGSTASSGSSAAITANDFLTLLVTEIQNQDPTSQTDPMTYITQLVGVNSLQQLLQINQTLSTDLGSPASSATGGTPSGSSPSVASAVVPAVQTAAAPEAAAASAHLFSEAVNGPATPASSNAVAQALTQPQPVAPPTAVPLNPEVMRALERSIPGAQPIGSSAGTHQP